MSSREVAPALEEVRIKAEFQDKTEYTIRINVPKANVKMVRVAVETLAKVITRYPHFGRLFIVQLQRAAEAAAAFDFFGGDEGPAR